jgi:segregation and condensation protein A
MDASQAAQPLAIVQGTPYLELPEDLYIPPDALEVFLEAFEGPLDLLLYLIKKENLDILNIPVAQVTDQYIRYIEMMGVLRLELAAEYLVMAALLAEIKSRMLLPRPPAADEEEDDPRAELIRRLQEYETIKKAAEDLDRLPRNERDTFEAHADTGDIKAPKIFPQVELREILLAFQDVLRRAEQLSHHQIVKEPLSVRERMSNILERLNRGNGLAFSQLFVKKEGRHGAVVSFLAILELAKEGLIEIMQTEPLAELRIRMVGV